MKMLDDAGWISENRRADLMMQDIPYFARRHEKKMLRHVLLKSKGYEFQSDLHQAK